MIEKELGLIWQLKLYNPSGKELALRPQFYYLESIFPFFWGLDVKSAASFPRFQSLCRDKITDI